MEEVKIEKWKDILELDIAYPLEYYRGQSNAKWPIRSSLERLVAGTEYQEDPVNLEFWLLREFKRGASQYLKSVPKENDYVAWLALMQHYGTPTRLVDFTKSFYIACYFALSGATSNSAIWTVDCFTGFHEAEVDMTTGLRDEWEKKSNEAGNKFLHSILSSASLASNAAPPLGVIAIEPYQQHSRLSIQQGLFFMPLDIQSPFNKNFSAYKKNNLRIKKIILSENIIDEGLAHLKAMNITSETLFPGIEGFAKSIVHKYMYKN